MAGNAVFRHGADPSQIFGGKRGGQQGAYDSANAVDGEDIQSIVDLQLTFDPMQGGKAQRPGDQTDGCPAQWADKAGRWGDHAQPRHHAGDKP